MKTKLGRFLTLFLILILVPFSVLAEDGATADTKADGMPYVLNAFEGTTLDLTQYEGKAIWLNFFTGWCPYCMTELPYIKQIFEDYDPEQLEIVLIHVWDGEDAEDSQAIIEEYGLQDMNMVEDEDMALTTLVGLQGYPTSYFIDKEGYLYGGTYGLDYDGMAAYMDGMNVARRTAATDESATVTDGADASASATPAVKR